MVGNQVDKKWKLVSIGVYTKMRLSQNNVYLFGNPVLRTEYIRGLYRGSMFWEIARTRV